MGGHRQFGGTLGAQVVKVFDLVVARTGLRETEAKDAGFDPLTVESTIWDHTVYHPGASTLHMRVTGDRKTGRLLGAQIVGHFHGEVAKRMDVFATALFHGMRIARNAGERCCSPAFRAFTGWTWRAAPVPRSGSMHTMEQASCEKPVPVSHGADVVLRSERVAATPDCSSRS